MRRLTLDAPSPWPVACSRWDDACLAPILWFDPCGASFRPDRPKRAPPRAAAVKDGALARHPKGWSLPGR
jgi:hypothetical protein